MADDKRGTGRDIPSDEMLARRRLLKLGAYIPPAILGMMILGLPQSAEAVVGSCCPSACNPCIELASGDIDNRRECFRKWRRCRRKRRRMGCPPIPYPCRGVGRGRG